MSTVSRILNPIDNPLIQKLLVYNFPDYPSVTGLAKPITVRSLAAFVYALGWSWLLLISFTGWGRLFGKFLGCLDLPASVACSIGIATVIFLGGLLNLLHALYPAVLVLLVLAGALLYVRLRASAPPQYRWRSFWAEASTPARMLLVFAFLLLLFRVIATVRLGMFNELDDGAAYMVFPHKLLASHAFAYDPFSDRRVISSLGGAYLLQALVIVGTSLTHIAMADRTLGLILLGATIFDLGIAFELPIFSLALMELLAYCVPQGTINLTFTILPTSLLLAMVWLVLQKGYPAFLQYAALAGAVGGALISLKSTYLPCVGAFLVIPYLLLHARENGTCIWRLPAMAGASCVATILAWMIAMKLNSGTYMFPVFGSGVDYGSYGLIHTVTAFASRRTFFKIFLQATALLTLAGVQIMATRLKPWQYRLSLGVLIASAIAITAFNYKSGGDFIWRYNFSQFFVAILVFYAANAGAMTGQSVGFGARAALYCAVAALALMVFYYDVSGQNPRPFRQVGIEWGDYVKGLRASVTGVEIASPTIIQEYRAVQNALPKNASAIENTAYPFLLSYRHQTTFIADWPGAASPKPGWPFQPDLGSLTSYLKSHGIEDVIYDYRYARWMDGEGCKALEQANRNSLELRALWRISIVTHDQFEQLRLHYHSLYDDGSIAVVDLNHPLARNSTEMPVWTLSTGTNEICADVMARNLKDPPLPKTVN